MRISDWSSDVCSSDLPTEDRMSEEFYRIKRLPPYVIAEVNGMRAAARAAGEDIIDLGMGNPDLPPPDHVIEKLCEVARKPDAHGYSPSKGIPGLRRAPAGYYARRPEEHPSELKSLLRISYAVF